MSVAALMRGSTIGIIGGGQLGRMLAMAAARLGYRCVILDPDPDCPAAQVASRQIVGDFGDLDALESLASSCHLITYEFENVPVGGVTRLSRSVTVYPPARALEVSQDRVAEKTFVNGLGIRTAEFRPVDTDAELADALSAFSGRGVLKTRRFGYDGKGQRVFRGQGEAVTGIVEAMGGGDLILESLVPFEREISIIAARDPQGAIVCYEPAENEHRNGILARSTVPAHVRSETVAAARAAAEAIMAGLDYVGVIGIEFFVLPGGELLVNEIAPRVHNSGHWTEALCAVSQFENHIRAICGLPLGSPERHSDGVMENLVGEEVERARALLDMPRAVLHLYGKAKIRPGRKMGHVTHLTGSAKSGKAV